MRCLPHPRAGRRGVAPLALLAAAFFSGCDAPSEAPSVVLILVDQLRQDAVAKWMPEVSRLAAHGVELDSMRSAAPWTYPSVVSMFSGLYPQDHGADGDPLNGKLLSTFDEGVPLLSRSIGETHYTAGFVTNPFFQKWNPFHASFDHYEVDPFIGSQGNARGRPEDVWTEDMFADHVNRRVIEHFDARGLSDPEFVYVHYIDVHGPWEGAPFDVGGADHRKTNDAAYEIAARYTDGKIRELYDYFMTRYGGDLVFIVTSDHGQELGDDLSIGANPKLRGRKKTVHDFNTRIPFLILPSQEVPAALELDLPCSNVDVMPTVLEWVGLEAPEGIRGVSLLPWIRGERSPSEAHARPVYSIMSAFGSRNDCVVIGTKKLMRHSHPETGQVAIRQVFDLERDPRETRAASETFGPDGRILNATAAEAPLSFARRFIKPEERTLDAMQALGYMGDDDDED